MKREALIIFIKNAVPGKTKTRLAQSIGDDNALAVYRILLAHTHRITSGLTCATFVFYSDAIMPQDCWQQSGCRQCLQQGNDLGERMRNAFQSVFEQQYQKVVIIGSDCYELTSEILQQAFIKLNTTDVVIGPAKDGGYYLLGIKALHEPLFQNKTWSSHSVLAETLQSIKSSQLRVQLLQQLSDIDTVADLHAPPFHRFIPS